MSAGTKIYPCRLPEDLVNLVHATIHLRNHHARSAPWTFSDFLRKALEEKILKMGRSRKRHLGKDEEELILDPEEAE